MRIDEILKQYDREWLLIQVKEYDENWEPVDGEVLFHSPIADEVGKEELKLKGQKINFAVLYAGEFPEDIAVLL
ncbi:MAG: hypothetical protein ONB44_22485 [candidate division KSB1 bacterium]|nr:hypothetical protein [candidate division KSB1 bacterium]MDZ7304906.1 hypothetical protein [candidate division KSB1 bacterium]MDZ7313958.1 hypothetical protein [candidate division KSB1 bacterium]